jgi:hypothetical protein
MELKERRAGKSHALKKCGWEKNIRNFLDLMESSEKERIFLFKAIVDIRLKKLTEY